MLALGHSMSMLRTAPLNSGNYLFNVGPQPMGWVERQHSLGGFPAPLSTPLSSTREDKKRKKRSVTDLTHE
jgi:hypothetical protein